MSKNYLLVASMVTIATVAVNMILTISTRISLISGIEKHHLVFISMMYDNLRWVKKNIKCYLSIIKRNTFICSVMYPYYLPGSSDFIFLLNVISSLKKTNLDIYLALINSVVSNSSAAFSLLRQTAISILTLTH